MRVVGYLNLLGVMLLAVLCAAQWNQNRRLNLLNAQLDRTRQEQVQKIAEQEASIKGVTADRDDFRDRLEHSEDAVKKAEADIVALGAERDRINAEFKRASAERDELRTSLAQWEAAVKERDEAMKKEGDEIQTLVKSRDDAVAKFNDLVVKYNGIVKDLDAAREAGGALRSAVARAARPWLAVLGKRRSYAAGIGKMWSDIIPLRLPCRFARAFIG